jgi:hypothetical protein
MIQLPLLLLACSDTPQINRLYPEMAILPEEIDFEGVVVGEASTRAVTILNGGRAPLDLDSITLSSGSNAFSLELPDTDEVLEDEQVDVWVTFTPPNFVVYDDVLVIETNDPDYEEAPISVPLTGEGVDAPRPDLCLDPEFLDYGEVPAGQASTDWVVVENCGDGDLVIESATISGSSAFSIGSGDPAGQTLNPDQDSLTIIVLYNPGGSTGDSGTLTLTTNDPEQPEVAIPLIGNGGGGDDYPIAVIDCPPEAAPLDTLALDGTGSYDPTGKAIESWSWTLTERPDGSQSEMQAVTNDVATVFLDSAGWYEAALVVENELGVESEPAFCRVEAIPDDAIHVELTWNTGDTDLDLHMLNGAESEWGEPGPDDNAKLDLDDLSGYGPENINIHEPADGDYYVKVHYYGTSNSDIPTTTATIRVYIDGDLHTEVTQLLDRQDLWEVGYVSWPDKDFVMPDKPVVNSTTLNGCY